jgi:hypothetical protein
MQCPRLILCLLVALAVAPPGALEGRAAAAGTHPPRGLQDPGAFSDSVLAHVNGHEITVSRFRSAWREAYPEASLDTLTPHAAKGFLELLIDRDLLTRAALREQWTWTTEESAGYASLADRLAMRTALTAVLQETRLARVGVGDSLPDPETLGILARERIMERLKVRMNDATLAHIWKRFEALPRPSSDSSLSAQLRMLKTLPALTPAETTRVLASYQGGEYRVGDLLDSWQRLSPVYRPRLETATQLADVVKNGIFERWLRESSRAVAYERDPEIGAALQRHRELIAVSHLVNREVHDRIVSDSLVLMRFHRDHPDRWVVPARLRLVQLVFADRAQATRMALQLRDPLVAESLVALGRRSGIEYERVVSAEEDEILFQRGLRAGTGAVLGPDTLGGSWAVSRVVAVMPPRRRAFAEARSEVERDWYAEQSSRRIRALIERERRRADVRVHDRAVQRLSRSRPLESVVNP